MDGPQRNATASLAPTAYTKSAMQVGAGHAKAFVRKYDGWAGEDAYFCTTTE